MNAPLAASLIESAIAAGVVMVLVLPAMFRRHKAIALLTVLIAFLDTFARAWPRFRGTPLYFIHGDWDWNGKLFDFLVLLIFVAMFIATGLFTRQQLGLTLKQRPDTWRAVLFVILPLIVLTDAAVLSFAHHEVPSAEAIAYQLTLPGVTEELAYRGLLLALFDRMFPPSSTILGAKMGYGAIAVSLAFASVHSYLADRSLHIAFFPLFAISPLIGSFLGAWIRARSGSLVVPALAHNLSNTVTTVIPAFL